MQILVWGPTLSDDGDSINVLAYLALSVALVDCDPDTVQIDSGCRSIEIIVPTIPVNHDRSTTERASWESFV